MINIVRDPGFKKAYQKKIKTDDNLKNPFSKQLRTHKLTGTLKVLWAFSVDYDTRVIFSFLTDDEILLIDIGSHDEVY